jgi:hypothetical protein
MNVGFRWRNNYSHFAAVSRRYPISAGIGADDAGEAPMLGVVN